MKKRLILLVVCTIFILPAVIFAQAPVIMKQPMNRGVIAGQTAAFVIQSLGDSLSYKWLKNDTLIVGAIDSLYTTPPTALSDNKSKFKCIVTNSSGTDTSDAATLYVTASGLRVTEGMQLLYNFKETAGNAVFDNSGIGSPLNMLIDNSSAVSWTPKGLGTNDTAFIRTSTATKVINASLASNELTLETWIVPAFTNQSSLSRILTLADGYNSQNFAIMQTGDKFVVRMRSTETLPSAIGEGIATASGTVNTKLTHLVFTRRSDGISYFYINGNIAWIDSAQNGDLQNWFSTNRFQIANDFGDGAWLGTYYLATVYDRALDQPEVTANFNIGVDNDRKPEIVIQPQDLGLLVGQSAVFSVKYVGDSSSVQWRKNGIDLGGEIGLTYSIPSVSITDNFNDYSCVITNSFGSDTSRNAKLNVTALNNRVTNGQLALYTFQEAGGDTIKDVSGYNPLNLKIENLSDVEWKPYGLIVNSFPIIVSVSPASKVSDSVKAKGEFSFEAWVKPENLTQFPATIATLASTTLPNSANFTLNQDVNRIQSWFRTSTSPSSGTFMQTSPNSIGDSLIHILYTHNSKEISKIYINGILVSKQYNFGNLSNWDSSYSLKLADQFTAISPWKGFYNLISFYKRALSPSEITHNFAQGPINIDIVAPGNLTALATQTRKVNLKWKDNSNNEDGLIIERKEQGFGFVFVDSLAANDTSYTDVNLKDTTSYTYRIKAYNLFTESNFSNEASVTTLQFAINNPTNLVASLIPVEKLSAVRKVKLDWTDNSLNELGFAIQRKTGDSASINPFVSIDSVGTGVNTFTDLTVADTTVNTYRVFAFNADTVSGFSNFATIATILSTIQSPTNLAASLIPVDVTRNVKLDWTDNSLNELGFAIQRKTGDSASAAPFVSIDSVGTGVNTFTDLTVADTTTYTYRVFAFNADTVSGFSNTVTISTILSTIAAPTNLLAFLSPADTHNVKLSWVDNSSNELGFVIQRKTGDSASTELFVSIDSLLASATMYEDSTVEDTTKYTYRVFAYNADTVSAFSNIATIFTPVPVELVSFNANIQNGNVLLEWETASELNNAGFSIQRSKDNNSFVDLAFIKGKGTTTKPAYYSFVDKSNLYGKYQYRLKQVDLDGSVNYSNAIEIDLGMPKDYSLDQNYPNPFNPSTSIRFTIPVNATVSLILYNALGQEVDKILNADLEAGAHEVVFNASNLSSGVYFYMLKAIGFNNKNFTSTKRMVLMK